MFLILSIAWNVSLPSLSSLWPPEICSKGPSKAIGWILPTFTHKDDQLRLRKCSRLNYATNAQQCFELPQTLQNQALDAPKHC